MQVPYPILTTRLRKPEITSDLLLRTRLIRNLSNTVSLPLTLVSAGAGYGKSILISQWLDQLDCNYVWLSCVEDMNNIRIFLTYLIRGIKNAAPVQFRNTLALLEGPMEVPHKTIFHNFISELDTINERLIIVFDDFHSLRNTALIELIETLLKYPLPALHICILTRRDPPINLYQYKLKHSLAEFRMKDLHFTRTEIKEYAKRQFNIFLNPQEVKELKEKTEGWILGLKEALIIFQKTESNEGLRKTILAQDFKDLFFEEIIFKQEDIMKDALLISSLFERFCNHMLYHILKEYHGYDLQTRNIIQEFKRNNFFIISLDNQKKWYRFHHQFQVILREYLSEQVSKETVREYLKSGSSWLIENGYYEEGIERAVKTDDPGFAIDFFAKIKYILLNSDQYNRLRYLLEIFPVSWQGNYPELVITKALIFEIQGKYDSIPPVIKQFKQIAGQEKVSDMDLAEYYFLKGVELFYSGKSKESYESSEKSISLNPYNSGYTYTVALAHMAYSMNNIKLREKAFLLLNKYFDSLSVSAHFDKGRIQAAKAILHSYNGELKEIDKLLPSIIDPSRSFKHYITLSYGLYMKVMLCYFWNRFDDCTDTFESSFENRFRMRSSYFLQIWGVKALIHVKRKENKLLNTTLTEIEEFVYQINDHSIEQLQRCLFAEIAIQKGDMAEAGDIARNTDLSPNLSTFLFYIPHFTMLKLLLRTDNPEHKRKYIEIKRELEDFAQETNHEYSKLNLHLIGALELYISGDENKAIDNLMDALELSSLQNNLMIYTEYGDEIYELLKKLPEVIRGQNHVMSIEKLFKEIQTKKSAEEISYPKHEIKLNGRDVKILKMVSRGYKNSEIAQSMFLSPESIKKYIYEIFQKLEVDNRIKAVLKANELGLID